MSHVTRWWWIRHAPVPNRYQIYGRCDVAADCSNRLAFEKQAIHLPAQGIWWRSNLMRTAQTLAALRAARHRLGLPILKDKIYIEPDFAEQDFGSWAGLTHDTIRTRWSERAHRFWIAPASVSPPGGESFADLVTRVRGAIARIHRLHQGCDVIVCAHGGTIRAAIGIALGLDPESMLGLSVYNLSLTQLNHIASDPPVWQVITINRLA